MSEDEERLSFDFRAPSREVLKSTNHSFQESGVVILRSAFDPFLIQSICEVALRLVEHLSSLDDGQRRQLPPSYNAHSKNLSPSLIAMNDWLTQAGAGDYILLEAIEKSAISEILRGVLGENVVCTLFHSRMRIQRPECTDDVKIKPKGFHQDAGVGHLKSCTLWLPLTPCDEQYPGLKVFPKRLDRVLGNRVSEEEIKKYLYDCAPLSPRLEQGDAILFSDRNVHATDMRMATASKDRLSIDLRFFPLGEVAESSKRQPVVALSNFKATEASENPKIAKKLAHSAENSADAKIAELEMLATQAINQGRRNASVSYRNKAAHLRIDQTRSRGLVPGLMMNAIPKSGSKYIRKVLMTALNLEHKNVILGRFPDKVYNEKTLQSCALSTCIMQGHAGANRYNLLQLNLAFDRLVVHVRDPRQGILSLVKYFDHYLKDRPESLLLFNLPDNFFDLSMEKRIDWGIEIYGPVLVDWITGWIDAHNNPNFHPEILFTDFNVMLRDERAFFRKIVDFYDVSEFYDETKIESVGNVNFRRGDKEEWRQVMSGKQTRRLTSLIPESLFTRFGWSA